MSTSDAGIKHFESTFTLTMGDLRMTPELRDSVLVVNCWDDSNKGDAAITIGVLNTLVVNQAASLLKVSSYVVHQTEDEMRHAFRHVTQAHPHVDLVPCYLPALSRSIGKATVLIRLIRSIAKLLLPGVIPDTQLDAAVRSAKTVASNGGLYFGFRPSSAANMLYHLFAFSYPMLLAKRLGVPFVLFSQSFGPLPSRLSRWWMRMLVNHSHGAWCRESLSYDVLKNLRLNESKLKVVPDAAFGISSSHNSNLDQLPLQGLAPGSYVAMSIRSLVPSGFSEEAESAYLQAFREAIEWLSVECNIHVLLVAHTIGPIADEDDRITTRAVYDQLNPKALNNVTVCDLDLSPQQLCTLYGNAKAVVATRFHAVVLTLCGGTPVIAIPYFGIKTQGALRDIGLASAVVEVGSLNGNMLKEKLAFYIANQAASRSEIAVLAARLYEGAMHSGAMLKELALQTASV